jgi:hypothetical protein
MRRIPIFLLAVGWVLRSAIAQEIEANPVPFAVYPIKTELQRKLLARSDDEASRLRAFVAIQGNGLVSEEGMIDATALPIKEISKALAPYADRAKGIVVMRMQFGNDIDGKLRFPSRLAGEALDLLFEGLGARSGFSSISLSQSFGGPILQQKIDLAVAKAAEKPDEDEIPSGDELVRVYPIKSVLSLLLTDNTDCLVEIRAKLDKNGDNLLSPEIREAIVKHTSSVELRDMNSVRFSFKYRTSQINADRIDRFLRTELMELSRELGFTKTTSTMSGYGDK